MAPVVGTFEPDPADHLVFHRYADAVNHNLTELELALHTNLRSAPFLANEVVKMRNWTNRRNAAIRELLL